MRKLLITILSIPFLFSCSKEYQFNSKYPDSFKLRGEIESIYEWTFGLAFYGEDSLLNDSDFQYIHENCEIDRRETAYYKFDNLLHLIERGIKHDYDSIWDKTFFIGDSLEKSVHGENIQLLKYSIDSIWSSDTLRIIKECNFENFNRRTTIVFDNNLPIEITEEVPFNSKTSLKWNRKNQLIESEYKGDVLTGNSRTIYQYNEKGFISNEKTFLYSGSHADTLSRNFEYIYDKQENWIIRTELFDDVVFEIKNRVIEYK